MRGRGGKKNGDDTGGGRRVSLAKPGLKAVAPRPALGRGPYARSLGMHTVMGWRWRVQHRLSESTGSGWRRPRRCAGTRSGHPSHSPTPWGPRPAPDPLAARSGQACVWERAGRRAGPDLRQRRQRRPAPRSNSRARCLSVQENPARFEA